MGKYDSPTSILITGASSGIGSVLAQSYARDGVTLALGGRNRERLEAVADAVRAAGAQCTVAQVDVSDAEAMRDWIVRADRAAPLDLVIANAGISAGTRKATRGTQGDDSRVFATNILGVANTVVPIQPRMRERGHGQIALMSSLAGYHGFADAPAYCASKSAVRLYGTALRKAYRKDGVGVSVICPGFVRSPMTDVNDFRMPMLMDANPTARIICRGLARNRRVIAFPWPMYIGARLLSLFGD